MKLKLIVIAIVLLVFTQGTGFVNGILEERKAQDNENLTEQVNALIEAGHQPSGIFELCNKPLPPSNPLEFPQTPTL
jgi:hypothetical protein